MQQKLLAAVQANGQISEGHFVHRSGDGFAMAGGEKPNQYWLYRRSG